MQILTGHGIYNSYCKRIDKEVETKCWNCEDPNDDAEHVLFVCPKWIDRSMIYSYNELQKGDGKGYGVGEQERYRHATLNIRGHG